MKSIEPSAVRLELIAWLGLLVVYSPSTARGDQALEERPRLLVLTDIGGDPDDQQSLVRLMCYANEFEIEGLIASSAGTLGELKDHVTKPELIREIVEAYGQVRDSLARHADGYPSAEQLLERVKSGNPNRGLKAIGEGHDTDGSRWIIAAVDRAVQLGDERPLNITIWGGQTDLAQVLWRVRKDRGDEGLQSFLKNIRVYDIGDQDQIAEWMWKEYPIPFYILNFAPKGADKREGALRGMYLGGDQSLTSRDWMEKNIRTGHGPLGALYPPDTWTEPNPHGAIKEGDTPSWFYFLPHGLNEPAEPTWGCWGGRFRRIESGAYRDAADTVGDQTHARATVWRWRPHFQADFQARLDWCTTDEFAKANHNPIAVLNGDKSRRVVGISARPGEVVELSAAGSSDPDDQPFAMRWFVYGEPGGFAGEVRLSSAEGETTSFTMPDCRDGQSVHVILEVRDGGQPSLSAFRRVVVSNQRREE